jgi:hypothetical protein
LNLQQHVQQALLVEAQGRLFCPGSHLGWTSTKTPRRMLDRFCDSFDLSSTLLSAKRDGIAAIGSILSDSGNGGD